LPRLCAGRVRNDSAAASERRDSLSDREGPDLSDREAPDLSAREAPVRRDLLSVRLLRAGSESPTQKARGGGGGGGGGVLGSVDEECAAACGVERRGGGSGALFRLCSVRLY
jgi:hypothetical protein